MTHLLVGEMVVMIPCSIRRHNPTHISKLRPLRLPSLVFNAFCTQYLIYFCAANIFKRLILDDMYACAGHRMMGLVHSSILCRL